MHQSCRAGESPAARLLRAQQSVLLLHGRRHICSRVIHYALCEIACLQWLESMGLTSYAALLANDLKVYVHQATVLCNFEIACSVTEDVFEEGSMASHCGILTSQAGYDAEKARSTFTPPLQLQAVE